MIVAFTGIRELGVGDDAMIGAAILGLVGRGVTAIRFGGARGADTIALEAAGEIEVERIVVVPYQVKDQPWRAQQAIRKYATQVIELDHKPGDKAAYHIRNAVLVKGQAVLELPADLVLAATDGRTDGGTASSIRIAKGAKIPLEIIAVKGIRR